MNPFPVVQRQDTRFWISSSWFESTPGDPGRLAQWQGAGLKYRRSWFDSTADHQVHVVHWQVAQSVERPAVNRDDAGPNPALPACSLRRAGLRPARWALSVVGPASRKRGFDSRCQQSAPVVQRFRTPGFQSGKQGSSPCWSSSWDSILTYTCNRVFKDPSRVEKSISLASCAGDRRIEPAPATIVHRQLRMPSAMFPNASSRPDCAPTLWPQRLGSLRTWLVGTAAGGGDSARKLIACRWFPLRR